MVILKGELIRAKFVCCRLLAPGDSVVQRVRFVRRASVLVQHHAHVLHQPGPVFRHQQSAENQAHVFHQTTGWNKNRHRVGAFVDGFRLGHLSR